MVSEAARSARGRANFLLALLLSGNSNGFQSHLDHLRDSQHPGVAALRALAHEANQSRGVFSKIVPVYGGARSLTFGK